MGEAKRKRDKFDRLSPADRKAVELTRDLLNAGKLIEGGFAAYILNERIELDDPRLPLLRDVYLTGAEHLWSSIFAAALDPGIEETAAELRRMDLIQKELDEWRKQKLAALATAMPTSGSA